MSLSSSVRHTVMSVTAKWHDSCEAGVLLRTTVESLWGRQPNAPYAFMQLAARHTLNSSSESEDTHTISASCHSDEGSSAAAHGAPCPSTSLLKPSMPACPACSNAHIHVQPSRHQTGHTSHQCTHACPGSSCSRQAAPPHWTSLPAQPVVLLLLVQAVPHHVGCLLPGGGSRIAITDHPNREVPGSHWGHEHSEGCQGSPEELSLPLPDREGQPVFVDPAEVGLPPVVEAGGQHSPPHQDGPAHQQVCQQQPAHGGVPCPLGGAEPLPQPAGTWCQAGLRATA